MHVLYIHQHFSTPSGAAGTRSYEMARRLIAQGHCVTMVCGSYKAGKTGLQQRFRHSRREGEVDGIQVIEFDLAYSNHDGLARRTAVFLRYALGAMGLALTRRYDLLLETSTPLTASLPGLVARWLRGKPFVFEVRDLWPELPRAMGVIRNRALLAVLGALEWVACRSATRCIALAPGIAQGIAKTGVDPRRIEVVANGCDISLFQSPGVPWRPPGIPPENLLAVFTGTHGPANGLNAVLDAAAILLARGRYDISLVLAGDGKCKPALVQRARDQGLSNVMFVEPMPKAELAGLLAGADLGIQCLADIPAFYFGTSPNKFFDYIAAGLPVLNNYPGWLAKMIESEGLGFAVPPRDSAAFADALERAAGNRGETRRMGARAVDFARHNFARDILAERWIGWVTGAAR